MPWHFSKMKITTTYFSTFFTDKNSFNDSSDINRFYEEIILESERNFVASKKLWCKHTTKSYFVFCYLGLDYKSCSTHAVEVKPAAYSESLLLQSGKEWK